MRPSIVLSGYPGTGKTVVAQLLALHQGFTRLDVAELLQTVLTAEGVKPRSRADIGPLFLQRHSSYEIYQLIAARLELSSKVVVDAVRLEATAVRLAGHDSLEVWYVEAPESTRLERLTERLLDAGISEDELARHLGWYDAYNEQQDRIRYQASRIIKNDGDFDALRAVVNAAVLARS